MCLSHHSKSCKCSACVVCAQGVYGAGAHTDYGVLTILATDESPGLQIHTEGKWQHVKPVSGTFVINLGDMLERCPAANVVASLLSATQSTSCVLVCYITCPHVQGHTGFAHHAQHAVWVHDTRNIG